VWVFVPILLASYTPSTAPPVAAPKPRAIAREPSAPVAVATASTRSVVRMPPATPEAPVPAAPATIRAVTDTDPVPRRDQPAAPLSAPAAIAPAPPPSGLSAAAAAVPWPIAAPTASPPPRTPNMQFASASPTAPAADDGETVPLPRSRPSRLIAARLAIPLPRPRPDILSDGTSAEQAAFERQVERMR